jgi:hypothetical protein
VALQYANEKPVYRIAWTVSVLAWLAIVVGTFGAALLWIGIFGLAYLFAQSAFISYVRGSAVQVDVG